jgi:hypothetical protein
MALLISRQVEDGVKERPVRSKWRTTSQPANSGEPNSVARLDRPLRFLLAVSGLASFRTLKLWRAPHTPAVA